MRRLALLALLSGLSATAGCGKKPAAAPPAGAAAKPAATPAPATPATERAKYLAALRSNNQAARRTAIEELSWLAEDDPTVLPALVEMLKEKGTAGAGRTLANQINSTREAAALAILQCTNGPKVMKEKGLPVLREGLTDPSPVIREHTAYTIGQLGPVAKPLAGDVQKLCTDPNENVRGVAFDTLRVVGVADPVALAGLLTDKNEDVVRLAAELIPQVADMPAAAVAPLSAALASDNSNIRAAAAAGLAVAGPKAAPAARQLADTIRKSYPAEFDPKTGQLDGPEAVYWTALGRIGEAAVAPTAKLLGHSNTLVRLLAARTLGEIGAPAKAATDALKKALNDPIVNVCIEAAVTLSDLGEAQAECVAVMKRALAAPNEGVAAAAIEGIPRMGAAGKELVPLALAKMADADPAARSAAVGLVGLLPPADATRVAADLGKRATDKQPVIRRRVGVVLEQIGPAGAAAADALGKALPGETELDIREQYIAALVAMGPGAKPALPALLPLATDAGLSPPLRARVLRAVAAIDPASPEVSAALVKAAADSDELVRAAAADALARLDPIPPAALATLVKLAESDRKNEPRVAALRALAAAGPRAKAARGDLEAMAAGPQPGLALWAKVAVAAVDGDVKKAAPAVRAGLAARNVQARASAAAALALIGPTPADLPALLKLTKELNGATKVAAATALGMIGPAAKEAVPQLTGMLGGELDVRLAAVVALGRIGPDAKPAARKLKRLLKDPSVRVAAMWALEKIGEK